MNVKRFIVATVVVFVYIFFYEWIFHTMILKDIYLATQSLWRSSVQMQAHFGWLVFGQFLLALMFCFIFAKGYQAKGLLEGVRYGIYITILLTGPHLIMYAVQPIPANLQFYWFIGGFVELVVAGMLVSLIYKK